MIFFKAPDGYGISAPVGRLWLGSSKRSESDFKRCFLPLEISDKRIKETHSSEDSPLLSSDVLRSCYG